MSERIDFDDDELATAASWHAGQETMLYAISSTGYLARGTIRPRHCTTDAEWWADIRERLASECEETIRQARKQLKGTRGADREALKLDIINLQNIAYQAREGR